MNEEALKDAFTLFQQSGYNKSIEDFKTLVRTNNDALSDAHKLFTGAGYNKSIDDFAKLIGITDEVEKKNLVDGTSPMEPMDSTLPQAEADTLSESEELAETKDISDKYEGISLFMEDEESEIAKKLDANTRRIGAQLSRIPLFLAEQVFTVAAPNDLKEYVNRLPAEQREDFISSLVGLGGPTGISSLTDFYQGQSEKIKEIEDTYKKYETSIGEDFADLDLGQALDRTFTEIVGGAPQLVQAMVPVVGIASIVAGSAAEKSGELQREGEDLGLRTSLNSIVSGAAEGVFEIVTKKLGKKLLDSFKVNPDEAIQTFGSKIKEILTDSGLEGGSELATTITQRVSDALIQGRELDVNDVIREAIDAFIIGGGTGGSLTGFGKAYTTTKQLAEKNQLARKIEDTKYNSIEDVFAPVVTPKGDLGKQTEIDQVTLDIASSNVSRKFVVEGLNRAVKKGDLTREQADQRLDDFDKIRAANSRVGEEVSGESRLKAVDLIREKQTIQQEIAGVEPALAKNKEARLQEIDQELEQLSNAIQEQETRGVPEAERTEGVREVEEEVRVTPEEETEVTEEERVEITPETSSNYANMTEDDDGNFVFFHKGKKGYDTIKKGTGESGATSRPEISAISKVGGVAMYYSSASVGERQVSGDTTYAVKIPKEKVYDFNSDPLNFIEEARKRHTEENPNTAFDANSQFAYVTQIANENGFEMVVGEWTNGSTRAQTTKELSPDDTQERSGNTITKDFNNQYVDNRQKGFEPVIPTTKEEKLQTIYDKIYNERNSNQRYDDLYRLRSENTNYTQEEITELINNSDISQEIKDEYNNVLESKEEKRRSKRKNIIEEYAPKEVERVKSLPIEAEDGATMNLDGSKYENGGLVIPVASVNMKASDLTTEAIEQFINENSKSIGADNVKVGIYKFPNSDDVSIDINIVADRSMREEALKIGKELGQESLFDLDTFENIKTGADGKNPKKLTPKEFLQIQERLNLETPQQRVEVDQTLSEETLTGYDKMMNRIDDIIKRMSKKPDMTNEKILDSVTKNLQSRDPAYTRATDTQREQIIRDLRSRLGMKEKAAPSARKVTGKPKRKKVTVDEYAALKDQIKLEAKAARESVRGYKNAGKAIAEAVKELGGKGKLTVRQANTIAKKILRTNLTNDNQVNNLLNYLEKIYERAELAEMVSNARIRIKQAKKNLASKVGTNTALKSVVQGVLSLDPTDVPLNLLPQYVALVQSFGERKAVLNLPEQGVVMQTANAILDSIQESFDVTNTERVEDADYDLDQSIKEIREDKIDTKNILNPDVKKLAQKLNSLTKEDIEGLVTENKDGVKNYAKVENLKAVKREMSKGYAPKVANDLILEIESQRSYDSLENEGAIDRVQKRGITVIGRTIASIKSLITGRGITQEQLRSIPFIGTSLDNVLGNINQIQFRKKIIDPVANSFSMMTDKMQDVRNEYLQTAEYLLSNDGFVKRSRNSILKSKYKVQLYLLEKENLSNLGGNQVAPAIEFLNETIKYLSKDTSARRNMNKEILEELREEFAPNDSPLDFEKLENSLSKNEIQAATLINQAYNETSSMYEFVSSVVRGEGLKPLNNYVHHSVLKDLNEQKKDNNLTVDRMTKPSTKSKTIIERTPGAKAINFDPISSADRGIKMMLTDYYMTNPIREVRLLINKLKSTPDPTQFQRNAFEDLNKVFEESIEIVFSKSLESITGVNNFFNAVEELGYYAALASVPRAAAELGSNFAGAAIMNPRRFSLGVTNFGKLSFDSTSVAKFAAAIGSKSRSKLAPKGIGGKIQQELTNYNVTSRNKAALNPILDKANFIAKNTIGRIGNATADVAQKLLSTPDMAISRPMYFQTFVDEFQKITGEKLTIDDLQAIADGDTKILEKYPDAVSKARDVADTAIERLSGTTNPFKQPLKYQLKVGDDVFAKVYKKANKYMASFYSVENNTATEGVMALFYSGEITRRQATSLLAMITTRMTVYMSMYALLQNLFDQLISNALGLRQKDEEDEEDEDYGLLTFRQLVGSISTLILRRSLGSVSSIPVMYGIEKANEEYLGALRGGNEYDKFKNGIVYVPIRENKSPTEQGVSMISGAKGPALNTISRLATVLAGMSGSNKQETRNQYKEELLNRMSIEVLGNVGLLPFYKDIRRIVIEDIFSEREYQKAMKKLQKEIEKEEQEYYREQKKKSNGFGSKGFGSKGV